MNHQLEIDENMADRRLDLLLGEQLKLSRNETWKLLDRGLVRVNGRVMGRQDKGRRLTKGDQVCVAAFEVTAQQRPIANPDLPLKIVATGDDWLIIDKPAGVPVHPLTPEEDRTVLNAVMVKWPQIFGVGEAGLRSGVVHRLDVETSGVLLFALTEQRWQALREAFTNRRIRKTYLAIVQGRLEGQGHLELPLKIVRHRPAHVAVLTPDDRNTKGSRLCSLSWCSRYATDRGSLVEVDLHTGFLHQIRVMLAHLGHPLIGDQTYGGRTLWNATRPMLHASKIAFEDVVGECEVPADFAEVMSHLSASLPND